VVGIVFLFVVVVETVNIFNPIWGIVPCFGPIKKNHDLDYVDAQFN
jgi:hypothetical protein